MTVNYHLDLGDIQGIVMRAYRARCARFVFLHIDQCSGGQMLLEQLNSWITTAVDCPRGEDGKPLDHDTFSNVAITYTGLEALKLPWRSLDSFSSEFRQGMRRRAEWLGDDGDSGPEHWDTVWRTASRSVDLLLSIHAWHEDHRQLRFEQLQSLVDDVGGVQILATQDAAVLPEEKEHFGFRDGVSDPLMAGMLPKPKRVGRLTPEGTWQPMATGEFLLGHPDEGKETLDGPMPSLLARNSSYLVYRKLHQNVGALRAYLAQHGANYPGGQALMAAKMMGRWPDGTSLIHAPKCPPAETNLENKFLYGDDPDGIRVPLGSHVRRMNPRDEFGFDGKMVNRHRILRRGMSYGDVCPPGEPCDDSEERGLLFIAVNSNIERQFEFLQREWINNGNDFQLGNDRDPIAGSGDGNGRMLIPGDPEDLAVQPTWLCPDLPRFVEMRGGEYFFLPSLTALRQIAAGTVEED